MARWHNVDVYFPKWRGWQAGVNNLRASAVGWVAALEMQTATLFSSLSSSSRVRLSRAEKQVALVRKWVWLVLQLTVHFLSFFPPLGAKYPLPWSDMSAGDVVSLTRIKSSDVQLVTFALTQPRCSPWHPYQPVRIEKNKNGRCLCFPDHSFIYSLLHPLHGAKAVLHPGQGKTKAGTHAHWETCSSSQFASQFASQSDRVRPVMKYVQMRSMQKHVSILNNGI